MLYFLSNTFRFIRKISPTVDYQLRGLTFLLNFLFFLKCKIKDTLGTEHVLLYHYMAKFIHENLLISKNIF